MENTINANINDGSGFQPEIGETSKEGASKDGAFQGERFYLSATGLFFLAMCIIFLCLPRPEYSELEKRELETFPEISEYTENLSEYTSGISNWFSNTQPFRDDFLSMSMSLRNAMKLHFRSDEDAVSFIATSDSMEESPAAEVEDEGFELPENLAEENAKVANAGIIVAGNAPTARAMMVFGGSEKAGASYISTLNKYAEAFPNKNLYAVIAPTSGEYYMPKKVAGRNHSETPTLNNIKENLSPSIKYVDVHTALGRHAGEDIFLRTDHHWAPLGAFYAAEALAKKAGVPFKGLDAYEENVIHRFVGSMYGYSKDITVKQSAEDFVFYKPTGVDYTATFVTFTTNKDFQVTGATKPYESQYFKTFKDGSGNAYLSFMGTDQCLVHVKTNTPTSRKLLIIKDSFGNAFASNLFYSYSDIHIVDFRYFHRNIKDYVEENGITDIAFVFNIFNVCSSSSMGKVNRFLTQRDGEMAKPDPKEAKEDVEGSQPEEAESVEEAETSVETSPAPEETDPGITTQDPEVGSQPEPQREPESPQSETR